MFLKKVWRIPNFGGQYILPLMHKLKALAGVVEEKISKKTLAQRTSEYSKCVVSACVCMCVCTYMVTDNVVL